MLAQVHRGNVTAWFNDRSQPHLTKKGGEHSDPLEFACAGIAIFIVKSPCLGNQRWVRSELPCKMQIDERSEPHAHVLADRVRFAGDRVAYVVAETAVQARALTRRLTEVRVEHDAAVDRAIGEVEQLLGDPRRAPISE